MSNQLTLSEYAPLARVTLKLLPFSDHMVHMGLGIAGEFGESIDALKKVFIYGKEVDQTNRTEEIGDKLWYAANLLPELDVQVKVADRALNYGLAHGAQMLGQAAQGMQLGAFVLQLNKVIAEDCATLPSLNSETAPASGTAVQLVERLFGNIGVTAALLGVDVGEAMHLNIEKLKARYGDKFSEHAALNRNLGVERSVLEGSNVVSLGGIARVQLNG